MLVPPKRRQHAVADLPCDGDPQPDDGRDYARPPPKKARCADEGQAIRRAISEENRSSLNAQARQACADVGVSALRLVQALLLRAGAHVPDPARVSIDARLSELGSKLSSKTTRPCSAVYRLALLDALSASISSGLRGGCRSFVLPCAYESFSFSLNDPDSSCALAAAAGAALCDLMVHPSSIARYDVAETGRDAENSRSAGRSDAAPVVHGLPSDDSLQATDDLSSERVTSAENAAQPRTDAREGAVSTARDALGDGDSVGGRPEARTSSVSEVTSLPSSTPVEAPKGVTSSIEVAEAEAELRDDRTIANETELSQSDRPVQTADVGSANGALNGSSRARSPEIEDLPALVDEEEGDDSDREG